MEDSVTSILDFTNRDHLIGIEDGDPLPADAQTEVDLRRTHTAQISEDPSSLLTRSPLSSSLVAPVAMENRKKRFARLGRCFKKIVTR